MPITGVVVRRRVDDLDATVPFYERLTGASANRFSFASAQLAAVGPFLLFEAPGPNGDRLANVAATLTVDDLDNQLKQLERLGAELIAPPAQTPNGRRAIVRHPEGTIFEYVGS
jgi:predicted enzyme related to lactoylglutathione lyase